MTDPAPPDDEILVGTPERERAVGMLGDAFAQGYLQVDEFDESSRAAHAARTRGELRRTLAGLPTAETLFGARTDAVARRGLTSDVLTMNWTTVTRSGRWTVPEHLRLEGSMGTAKLDLRTAVWPPGGFTLELQVTWSTVRLRVPRDTEIRQDGFESRGWSSVKDKDAAAARPGGPTLVLTGLVTTSDVRVRRD